MPALTQEMIDDLASLAKKLEPRKPPPADAIKLTEKIFAAAQERIKKGVESAGKPSLELLETGVVASIKKGCGLTEANIVIGPLKNMERAAEKVAKDYGGDWYQLKDMVRMTVVVDDKKTMDKVRKTIREEICTVREGRGLAKDEPSKDGKPTDDLKPGDCGFTSVNMVALLENGRFAEIQINTYAVMYGQMKTKDFGKSFGEKKLAELNDKFTAWGGWGHVYYELYRSPPKGPNGPAVAKAAQDLSIRYFNHLRTEPKKVVGGALLKDMQAFQQKYSTEIGGLHPADREVGKLDESRLQPYQKPKSGEKH